ncbi:tetratricopeptide repeat protein [Cyanothece sp. BG0011]|uniref:tetratricopeptide repeat protein n=1 Tax=Cyanothece sp. BG0011 TaxID=2082950 RepID=UPI000D1EECDD|nr:tetratricopeptide repeat protein [Cyanothece sp. BG0011]
MENQVEQQELNNDNSKNNLSDLFDLLSGIGLVGGAVGSFFGNAAFAAIPISFSVALQIANRRQLKVDLAQLQESSVIQLTEQMNNNQGTILEQFKQFRKESEDQLNQQDQKVQTIVSELSEKITNNQESCNLLKVEKDQLNQLTHSLESQLNKIQNVVETLQKIENTSQVIRTNPQGVDAYYERGLSHQKLGDKTGAIEDYTEALHLDSTYAKAYHNRGILLAEMGNKKQAVEDLRLAAKYYFDQGDIESYEKARNLSKEFYEVRHSILDDKVIDSMVSQELTREENSSQEVNLITVGSLFEDDGDAEESISMLG